MTQNPGERAARELGGAVGRRGIAAAIHDRAAGDPVRVLAVAGDLFKGRLMQDRLPGTEPDGEEEPASEPEPAPVADFVPPPDRDLRLEIAAELRKLRYSIEHGGVGAREAPLLERLCDALERVLEYHPWVWATTPDVPDHCPGCSLGATWDDGAEYLAGLPCPEIAAIGSALRLEPQERREVGHHCYPMPDGLADRMVAAVAGDAGRRS